MGEPEGTREGERAEAPAGETEAERGVGTFLYRMALAGVGALVLAQEELEGRLRKLRGREGQGEGAGEGAPVEAASAPEQAAEDGPEESAEARKKKTLAGHIDATVSRVLHSLNVPTRGEVEELTRRLEELGRRLETLRR